LRDSLLRFVLFFVTAIIFFRYGIHFFCACSKHGEYIQYFGALLVELRLNFVLQWSAFLKLDNCLLWVNPDSYRMILRYFVLGVLSLGFY
jgi:hypothetical protein